MFNYNPMCDLVVGDRTENTYVEQCNDHNPSARTSSSVRMRVPTLMKMHILLCCRCQCAYTTLSGVQFTQSSH
eukprot:2046810-Karenia_brevis.AAC.1